MTGEHNWQEVKEDLESLLANPGWKRFAAFLEEQLAARRNQLELVPCKDAAGVYAQEFLKGEIATLRLLLVWTEQQLSLARSVLRVQTETEVAAADLSEGE